MMENKNSPRRVETQRFRGVSAASKLLDKFERQAQPAKPKFEPDDNKWTHVVQMIEYKALTDLYLYNMKIRKRDKHGEPALANITIPANATYKTTEMKDYLATATNNYCRILAH